MIAPADADLLVLEARHTTLQRLADDPRYLDLPDDVLDELPRLRRRMAAIRAEGPAGLAAQIRVLRWDLKTGGFPLLQPDDPTHALLDTILATAEALAGPAAVAREVHGPDCAPVFPGGQGRSGDG